MNIYEVTALEKEIERIAYENQGEIPEDKLQELVEAQTKSMAQIEKLCGYIRHIEIFIDTCKAEKNRINDLQKGAEKRLKSIKRYLAPYVKSKGGFDAGPHKLSIRASESVVLAEDFKHPQYVRVVEEVKPDKKLIKADLKKGIWIEGASLIKNDNLQIK